MVEALVPTFSKVRFCDSLFHMFILYLTFTYPILLTKVHFLQTYFPASSLRPQSFAMLCHLESHPSALDCVVEMELQYCAYSYFYQYYYDLRNFPQFGINATYRFIAVKKLLGKFDHVKHIFFVRVCQFISLFVSAILVV